MQPAGLPFQPAAEARVPAAGARQEVDADGRPLAAPGPQRRHRRREGLQGVGVGVEPPQRLDARPGEDQLGAQPDRVGGLPIVGKDLGDIAQLGAFVVAQGRAQRLMRASGDFEQVDEPAFAVVGQLHPHRVGAAVEPAAEAAVCPRHLSGEAQHRLGGIGETIGESLELHR